MVLLFASFGTIQAQRTKTVTAKGEKVGTDVQQTKRDALYEAKKNALLEAGLFEDITTNTLLVMDNSDGSSMTEAIAEVSMLMLDGRVLLKGEPKYNVVIPNNGDLIKVECTIRAEVIMEDKNDPTFRFKLEGFRSTYRIDEQLNIKITPYADCWIRLFWFDRTTDASVKGDMVFPNARVYNDLPFRKGQTYNFPDLPEDFLIRSKQKITMYKSSSQPMETNIIFVVALKKPIPYDKSDYSYESFMEWLMDIPADQRYMKWFPIGILDK